MGGTLSK